MQEALNISVVVHHQQSCFSYKTRDPVAPLGDKQEIAGKDKQIFTQMDRWTDKEALMLDIRGGKEGFMGKQLSYVTL